MAEENTISFRECKVEREKQWSIRGLKLAPTHTLPPK